MTVATPLFTSIDEKFSNYQFIYIMRFISLLTLLSLLCTSCFSPVSEEIQGNETDPHAVKITFSIGSVEQIPFDGSDTRTALESLCSRLTLSVFREGTKVKNINQQSGQDGFGVFSLSLSPGSYQIVFIAHNGLGNCSVSSPESITFANNKCTDTFYYYDTIEVSEAMNYSIDLRRAVAMFRLKTTDLIPASVAKMQFYYTGGSSTFDAVSGFGCKNSRQTETFSVASMVGSKGVFEVYTFPHAESGELKMTVTAFDDADGIVAEREYNPLPVTINKITQSEVEFFSGGGSAAGGFEVKIPDANGEWAGIVDI